MMRRFRVFAPILAIGLTSLGCGSDAASVSGTVTLDDQPMTTGNVAFHPVNGGPAANGGIDSSGHYSVVVGSGERLPPGDYVAVVVATESPKGPPNPAKAPAPGKLLTPKKYGDLKTSDLKFAVTAGSNTIDLKLSSK